MEDKISVSVFPDQFELLLSFCFNDQENGFNGFMLQVIFWKSQ